MGLWKKPALIADATTSAWKMKWLHGTTFTDFESSLQTNRKKQQIEMKRNKGTGGRVKKIGLNEEPLVSSFQE
jgi:hypothetical protein